MLQVVLFDLDDTLIVTRRQLFEQCVEVAQRLGLGAPSVHEFDRSYGQELFEASVQRWHPGVDLDEYLAHFRASTPGRVPVLTPGARSCLLELHTAGVGLGIITNSPQRATAPALRLLHPLEFCVCRNADDDLVKPDARVWDSVVRQTDADPTHLAYVGDSVSDAYFALRAGVHFFGVLTGATQRAEWMAAGVADACVLHDLGELPSALRRDGLL